MQRCSWCEGDELYERYHDEEWGVPVLDDQALFERLVLEGMQAGLSWITVLKKRAHMSERFSASILTSSPTHRIGLSRIG